MTRVKPRDEQNEKKMRNSFEIQRRFVSFRSNHFKFFQISFQFIQFI